VRTKNALAKATVSLSKDGGAEPSARSAETENTLRETHQRDPASFAANYGLGKFLVEGGRDAEAKPFLARASNVEAGDSSLRVQQKADLHHLLGDLAEHTGDPLAAVREYQRAAELVASETNIFDWGAELLLHHAPEPATEVFGNGNRLFPQSVRMLVGLGVAWYVRGSYEQAARSLCQAADLAPNDLTPYLFLGKILSVENSVSPAIAERVARFAEHQPQNAMANYYLAVSLWKQRKSADDKEIAARVQALLERAAALDPTLSEAFLQLGIVHAERKDFSQAIVAYEQAIQANPRLEQAHYRLAQAYRLSGQSAKAQNELKTYEEISREKASELDRERSDIKQFVYTLRGENPSETRP
jgi:tetratricopeptide (TPR) repeat protein